MPDSVVHSSSSSTSSSTGGLYTANKPVIQSPRNSIGECINGDYSSSSQTSPLSYCTTTGFSDLNNTHVYYSSSGMLPMNSLPSNVSMYSAKSVISTAPSYSRQSTQPPAPQTPTSIPDIILTGMAWIWFNKQFNRLLLDANAEESLLRQDFTKELASHSMSSFDTNDLFSTEFKTDMPIDPIDFDGLQILTDMTDSASEDNFRLDRA